jgi:hypothetical protein
MLITNLITRLKANAELNAFFTAHYGKEPRHLMGYRKSPKPDELPLLCYIPIKSAYKARYENQRTISIVIYLNDNRLLDDTLTVIEPDQQTAAETQLFSGAVRSDQAQEILINALKGMRLDDGFVIGFDFTINTDLTLGFPFFQAEVVFNVGSMNFNQR